jgi:hypothetical protein
LGIDILILQGRAKHLDLLAQAVVGHHGRKLHTSFTLPPSTQKGRFLLCTF